MLGLEVMKDGVPFAQKILYSLKRLNLEILSDFSSCIYSPVDDGSYEKDIFPLENMEKVFFSLLASFIIGAIPHGPEYHSMGCGQNSSGRSPERETCIAPASHLNLLGWRRIYDDPSVDF